MKALLFKLLNIDAQMQQHLHEARVYCVEAWAGWLVALVMTGVLLWVGICYYRDGRQPSFSFKLFLIGLRLMAFAVLMFVLFQPMLRVRLVDTVPATVAVLVDNSLSMSVKDKGSRETRLEVARGLLIRRTTPEAPPLLSQLQAKNRVRLYAVNADAYPISQLLHSPIPPSQSATTQLGTGLERVLNDLTGQPVSGVVMLTDGGNNMGTDPVSVAKRAGQLKIPIFTVGIGDPTPTRDIALTDVLADDTVRVNDTVTVSVGITQRGYAGREIPVTLTRDGAVVRQERVRLGADKTKQEVAFTFTPDKVGQFTFQITAPTQAGEVTDRNNRRAFNLRVVDKQLKVLYVEGEPRWEYRYLKNAILRDKRIEFSCLLTATPPIPPLSRGGDGFSHPPLVKGETIPSIPVVVEGVTVPSISFVVKGAAAPPIPLAKGTPVPSIPVAVKGATVPS
ncbi:MAG: VWA domain-containing protein, partial [Abditibacteriales bacterium]|nr:VWA domain-containing protein [Abditibacteriales bacterium]MDW8366329.1 VWA domain-containing protein [Abditibacteriales bacterium]